MRVYYRTPTTDLFWSHVDFTPTCWLWIGALDGKGYGKFHTTDDRKQHQAHRFVWKLLRGPISNNLWVLHRCDVRRCVRPSHLFLGTAQDNTNDMMMKGRHRTAPSGAIGERHGHAKLTEVQALELRGLYATGEYSVPFLAREYGVSINTVIRAATGALWKHL